LFSLSLNDSTTIISDQSICHAAFEDIFAERPKKEKTKSQFILKISVILTQNVFNSFISCLPIYILIFTYFRLT